MGVAVKVVGVLWHVVSPLAVLVRVTAGVTSGMMVTVALPLISLLQLAGLVATTVYIPAVVIEPKSTGPALPVWVPIRVLP